MAETKASGRIVFHKLAENAKPYIRYSDDGGKTFTAAKPWTETGEYGNGRNLATKRNSSAYVEFKLYNNLNEVKDIANVNKSAGGNTCYFSCKIEFINCKFNDKSRFSGQGDNSNEWGWSYKSPNGSVVANGVVDYNWKHSLINAQKGGTLSLRFDYVSGTVRISEPSVTIGDTRFPYTPAPEDQQFGLTPGRWTGIAFSDKGYPPMNVEDYDWSETKGRGVKSIVRYFALTNSKDTKPTGAGSTTAPTMTAQYRYLWCKDVTTYDNGDIVTGDWNLLGVYGDDGKAGTDAITLACDKQTIIVNTDSSGHVGSGQLTNAVSTITAYQGGKKIATNGSLVSCSAGVSATVTNANNATNVRITSIGNDSSTGYAYGSGSVNVNVTAGGITFPVVIPVATNIHAAVAKLTTDNASEHKSITASVTAAKTDAISQAKSYTDSQIKVEEGKISSKVSKTDFDSANNKVNARMTTIQQTTDNIKLLVDALGQNNILPDTAFLGTLPIYGTADTFTAGDDIMVSHDGHRYVEIATSGKTGENLYGSLSYVVNLSKGKTYTASVWAMCSKLSAMDMGAFFDAKGMAGTTYTAISAVDMKMDTNGVWKRQTLTFTPDKDYDHVRISFGLRRNGTLYLSEPQLEIGSIATPWTPNPKDIASALLPVGIDLQNQQITLTANKTLIQNQEGKKVAVFNQDGTIDATMIRSTGANGSVYIGQFESSPALIFTNSLGEICQMMTQNGLLKPINCTARLEYQCCSISKLNPVQPSLSKVVRTAVRKTTTSGTETGTGGGAEENPWSADDSQNSMINSETTTTGSTDTTTVVFSYGIRLDVTNIGFKETAFGNNLTVNMRAVSFAGSAATLTCGGGAFLRPSPWSGNTIIGRGETKNIAFGGSVTKSYNSTTLHYADYENLQFVVSLAGKVIASGMFTIKV